MTAPFGQRLVRPARQSMQVPQKMTGSTRTRVPLLMVSIAVLLAPAAAGAATAPAPTRRFAVVAGANRGPADRVALRYAVADADRFAKVVTGMGGVAS